MDEAVKRWVQSRAAKRHDGDVWACIEAELRAAMQAEQRPDDPWTWITERARAGTWPPHWVSVPDLLEFVQSWDPQRDGEHATDVLAALRARLQPRG